MKKKNILLPITALVSALVLTTSLYLVSNNKATDVNAYTVSSVPTTIDLNDCSEQEIRNYYSSLNSLSASERQGTNLLKNLKPILKNNQKYFSYGSSATTAVWQAYEIVDRDWDKSPASEISGYNANTNTITGYVYGTSNSNAGSNPYIHALYVNRDVDNEQRAWGNHNQVQWGINQEHIWAKSCGFENDSPAAGARGDLMHLWAGNGRVNGTTHSNYYYGYVDTTQSYNDEGSYASTLSGNLSGYSKSLGGSVKVFEPQDSDKGDIARAIFYMAARYNYLSGSDSDGIDAGNPNLEIVNNVTSWSNSGYQSTTTTTGKMGILQDLLAWNRLDPPDEWEIHRNNLLYNNFTNNRNPFIDFPSWADAIWGTVDSNGNYDSTVTTSASPSSDPINTQNTIEQFSISNETLELEVGETAEISANNANGNISWTVNDNSIISLNKSNTTNEEVVTITALKSGTTTVTATNGGNSVSCLITVNEPLNYGTLENPLSVDEAIELISITGSNATAEQMYVKGIVSSNSAYNTTYSNYDYVWLTNDDGTTSQALELFRVTASDDIKNTYGTANSMVDKEVVAYGYGVHYNNTTYELAKSNDVSPSIISISSIAPATAKEQICALETFSTLSYSYDKNEAGSVVDTLNQALTGATGTTYSDWSKKEGASGAIYAGNSAGGNDSIQLRSNNSNSGIITTSSGGKAAKVTVSWNTNTTTGRTIDIYGKNIAYTAASELYNSSSQGTKIGSIVCGTSTELTIDGEYAYIGIRSNSGALYLNSITITWSGATTYSFPTVGIRFGASISSDLWDSLKEESTILGYGLIFSYNNSDIKAAYETAETDSSSIDDALTTVCDGTNNINLYNELSESKPAPRLDEDNYTWNLYKKVSEANLTTCFSAVTYIRLDDEIIFLQQVTDVSAKSLAEQLLNDNNGVDPYDGSLTYLANL